jgi:polyisoprenoid-binding protein YceI
VTTRTKVLAGVGVAVLLIVGFGGWWFLVRDDAPAAVSLDEARETVDGEGATADVTVSGTWSVDPSIGSFDDFSGSFAGYRVEEELATIGANTAVGRTPDVVGDLVIDGPALTEATVTVDLANLASDESFRDGAAQGALQTDTFPDAMFVTTEAVDLGDEPTEGTAVITDVAGELTLHGETRPVVAALEAELVDGVIVVTGSVPIALGDFGVEAPARGPVVSVSDQGVIEFQLFFTMT